MSFQKSFFFLNLALSKAFWPPSNAFSGSAYASASCHHNQHACFCREALPQLGAKREAGRNIPPPLPSSVPSRMAKWPVPTEVKQIDRRQVNGRSIDGSREGKIWALEGTKFKKGITISENSSDFASTQPNKYPWSINEVS